MDDFATYINVWVVAFLPPLNKYLIGLSTLDDCIDYWHPVYFNSQEEARDYAENRTRSSEGIESKLLKKVFHEELIRIGYCGGVEIA